MTERDREQIAQYVTALLAACRKSHASGPGGSAMCICGAPCGGSHACSAMRYIRQALHRLDDLCEGQDETLAEYLTHL